MLSFVLAKARTKDNNAMRFGCLTVTLTKHRLVILSLIGKALVSVGKADDATIGEAVLQDVMLHDAIVLMGVDTDVCIM